MSYTAILNCAMLLGMCLPMGHGFSALPPESSKACTDRRACFDIVTSNTLQILLGSNVAFAHAASPIEGKGGYSYSNARVEEIGGALDLRTLTDEPDVAYPASMAGIWQCQHVITACDGDTFQAQQAWSALSGIMEEETYFTKPRVERYLTKFVTRDGNTVRDRGFELTSRSGNSASSVVWDPPNQVTYSSSRGKTVEFAVVQRRSEPITDQGFGFDELLRIATSNGLERAARVKRRYRRAYDEDGNRVVEGLEIVKTFRVLDGIAGIEFPTSTTKSVIRMTRPTDKLPL